MDLRLPEDQLFLSAAVEGAAGLEAESVVQPLVLDSFHAVD